MCMWDAATATFAAELRPEGFTVVAIHPGWVATDMGNGAATVLKTSPPVETPDSVAGMIKVLERLTPEKTGAFLNWKGEPMPW
jgi:NAD(P)-dependent dehydrogenase (short-subunit alcohol dehydrogenase family)